MEFGCPPWTRWQSSRPLSSSPTAPSQQPTPPIWYRHTHMWLSTRTHTHTHAHTQHARTCTHKLLLSLPLSFLHSSTSSLTPPLLPSLLHSILFSFPHSSSLSLTPPLLPSLFLSFPPSSSPPSLLFPHSSSPSPPIPPPHTIS